MASGGVCRFPPRDAYPGPTLPSARRVRCWPADGVPLRRPVNARGSLDRELRGPSASRGRPTGELTSEVGSPPLNVSLGKTNVSSGKTFVYESDGQRLVGAHPLPCHRHQLASAGRRCGQGARAAVPGDDAEPDLVAVGSTCRSSRSPSARLASQSTAVICAPGGELSSVGHFSRSALPAIICGPLRRAAR